MENITHNSSELTASNPACEQTPAPQTRYPLPATAGTGERPRMQQNGESPAFAGRKTTRISNPVSSLPRDHHAVELRYLRYFVTLAEELNFTRAAERLQVTPSALSMQLKKLEGILGIRLCDRNTSRVSLTIPGEVLMHESRRLLNSAQQLAETVIGAARGLNGILRVGIPGHLCHCFMPDVIITYRNRFPKVDVTLMDIDSDQHHLDALEQGQVNVGFTFDFQSPSLENMNHLLAIDAPMCVLMGAQHPLASLPEVTLDKVAAYPWLSLQHFGRQTQSLLDLFRQKKLNPQVVKKANSLNACAAMLVSGDSVALLPETNMISHYPNLVLRPIKDSLPGLRLQIYALWKKNEASLHVHNFIEVIEEVTNERRKKLGNLPPLPTV